MGMDFKTISVVAIVLGSAVYAIYEFFSNNEHSDQHQHRCSSPETGDSEDETNNRSSSNKKKHKKSMKRREDDCCPICLGTLMTGVLIGTICEHQFHDECLSKWLSNNYSCPVCRSQINFDEDD